LIGDLHHGSRENPGDPGIPGQLRRVMAQGTRYHAQNREDHVYDRHHEQEDPEGQRARQDAASLPASSF
jgi:hypothetical protein